MRELSPLEARCTLAANGYSCIPVNGKIPHIRGWQQWHHRDAEVIRLWERGYSDHRNTSLLTRDNPFLDLDIYDEDAAEDAALLVSSKFDGSFLPLRIGKSPKRGLLFQLSGDPFAKITVDLIGPDGREHRIEFLSNGNQVVVHGTHPETLKPYTWHAGSPFDIKHDDLIGITHSDAREIVNDVADMLVRDHGFKIKRGEPRQSENGQDHSWGECLSHLASHDHDTALAMKLIRSGMSDGAAVNFGRELIARHAGDDPDRIERRVNEWPAAVKSARGKIGETTARPVTAALPSIRASEVTMVATEWLWPNRFALGKLGLIAGLPDEGKGMITCDITSRVTRGAEWPCREGTAPQGSVIILTAEDDLNDTVVPRLASADANLDRIHFIQMIPDDKGQDRMFSLITDLPSLRLKLHEISDTNLVIIDPITAYLGTKIDSYRTTDVRAVLSPLVDLAQKTKIAIIAIMHFNKKTDVTNALLRISDSLAFGATARHVYTVVDDSEHERKVMVRAKNNLSSKSMDKALGYRFGGKIVGHDPVSGREIMAPHVIWEPDHIDITASEALAAANSSKSPSARDEAKKFLEDLLSAGPMPVPDIEENAKAEGISIRTLHRAKKELGLMAKKDDPKGGWRWHPPEPEHTSRWSDE